MDRLGDLAGWWLRAECGCGRSAALPIDLLAQRHGPGLRVQRVVARLRCGGCGAAPAGTALVRRPDEGASGAGG